MSRTLMCSMMSLLVLLTVVAALADGMAEAEAVADRGRYFENQGDYVTAIGKYRRIQELLARSAGEYEAYLGGWAMWREAYCHWVLDEFELARQAGQRAVAALEHPEHVYPELGGAYGMIGDACRDLGKYADAVVAHDKAAEVLEAAGDKGWALWNSYYAALAMHDLTDDEQHLEKAIARYQEVWRGLHPVDDEEELRALCLTKWGRALRQLAGEENLQASLQRLRQALPWAANIDAWDRAELYLELGWTYADWELGRHESALEAYRRALDLWRQEEGSEYNQALTLEGMAGGYEATDRRPEAIAAYSAAIELYRADGAIADVASALSSRAWCHCALDEYGRARQDHLEAARLHGEVGDDWKRVQSLYQSASRLREMEGDPALVLAEFNSVSAEIERRQISEHPRGWVDYDAGELLLEMGRTDEGLERLELAVQRAPGDFDLVMLSTNAAKEYAGHGRADRGTELLADAVKRGETEEVAGWAMGYAEQTWGEILHEQEQWQQAIAHYDAAITHYQEEVEFNAEEIERCREERAAAQRHEPPPEVEVGKAEQAPAEEATP